jgi:prepilin-type processing-associated H-X9-DG protein
MYCSRCGVQNPDGSTHCVNCGSILMNTPPGQPVGVQQAVSVMGAEPKTSGLAIASLVMGILTLFCSLFMAIPAIICGIIALVKIGKSNGQLKGNGFAIAGIVVPAVLSLVIVPLLLAILMPVLSRTKHIAQRVVCGTNLKGLSTAMMVYANDYDDQYPTPEQWCDLLIQEVDVSPKSFQCPLDPEGTFSYAINENAHKIETGRSPAQFVVLFESNLGRNGVGGMDDVVLRHNQHQGIGGNITFADGHTEFVTEGRIADLQWTIEE